MKDTQKSSLFTQLTTDESATINGGRYYYYPCNDYPSYYDGGYRRSTNTRVNVSTYVSVDVDN